VRGVGNLGGYTLVFGVYRVFLGIFRLDIGLACGFGVIFFGILGCMAWILGLWDLFLAGDGGFG
jgi:hypothetical protein